MNQTCGGMSAYETSFAEHDSLAKASVNATKNPEQDIKIKTSNATMSTAIILNAIMS